MSAPQKSPDAFRTISEVAEILDIPAHVLRFWESRFSQIRPVKRGGGRRYYRPADIDLLRGIRDLLYTEGLTIKGVQKILREKGTRHVVDLGHLEPQADPVVVGAEAAAEAAPAPEPARANGPVPHPPPRIEIRPGKAPAMQVDQFSAGRQSRRAFPPDPAQAARKAQLRVLLAKLQTLRAKMAAGLD